MVGLLIFHNKMQFRSVRRVRPFSKVVFENTLPMVFSTKSAKKIHRIMEILFFAKKDFIKDAFCKRTKMKNELITIDKISKRYISASVFNLPPQTISYGTIFNKINV